MTNEEKILAMLTAMQSDIAELKATQAEQGKALAELKSDVTTLKEDVGEIRETATRVAIMQENTVLPRIGTLAEGHAHLSKTLASKEQVEKIKGLVEDKVVVLEAVVKTHSARIAKLEKAQ